MRGRCPGMSHCSWMVSSKRVSKIRSGHVARQACRPATEAAEAAAIARQHVLAILHEAAQVGVADEDLDS